ncbi:hypothetical protein BJX61DRAFT_534474 [Aspergillus egyptiacus]|nr:hypothetical protein BJX61DRAFT_534474 [Aspergillus egyptiacus]
MGRLSEIFSSSSGKASNTSDIGRSWMLVNRPQSITNQSPERKTGVLEEMAPNELGGGSDDNNNKAVEDCEPREPPQVSGPPMESSVPDDGGLESMVVAPIPSGRFAGFKTLFRSRRRRRQRLSVLPKDGDAEHKYEDRFGGRPPTPEEARDQGVEGNHETPTTQPNLSTIHLTEVDIRKASDTTEKSVDSKGTSTTVCRHPSKRMSMPITVVDREVSQQNPFDDVWEATRSETSVSNPFTEGSKTTESMGQSSSVFSGSDIPFSSYPGHALELSGTSRGSSHSSWCGPTFAGFNGWPTPADRRLATNSFNQLASELYMEPLAISRDDAGQIVVNRGSVDETFFAAEDKLERRRDRLLGRIRTMRSTIQMKAEPAITGRSLRRMKTFTELGSPSCLMTSLRGKPLETLARLGGYSFLTLPGDFAPTTLSLPVCFVATMNYLRCFAPGVQNLFVDPGDLDTATQTYDHFAGQVLSAEKEKSTIHMTMRSSRMPSFLDEMSGPGLEARNPAQVLGIAFTFKELLSGLPGGILGSVQLYQILVNLCYGRVSQGPVQRTGSCLAGLSPEDYAKVRAMSLAILALTSTMQLNLICGVFGLCSLLLHETERMFEIERRTRRGSHRRSVTSSADKLTADRLATTLGPLLAETEREDGPDTFRAIQQEIESQRVAALLVTNWRSVSRQLRIWERRGLEGRLRAAPRTASGESTSPGAGT